MTNRSKAGLAGFLVLAAIGGGLVLTATNNGSNAAPYTVDVTVPDDLSVMARQGKIVFDAVCAECHGPNASGTDKGPPLVHDIYNPGHHADFAFFQAVRVGVRQHHWPYGNMPAQPGLTDPEIGAVVQYVRELQEANGIMEKPHGM